MYYFSHKAFKGLGVWFVCLFFSLGGLVCWYYLAFPVLGAFMMWCWGLEREIFTCKNDRRTKVA